MNQSTVATNCPDYVLTSDATTWMSMICILKREINKNHIAVDTDVEDVNYIIRLHYVSERHVYSTIFASKMKLLC